MPRFESNKSQILNTSTDPQDAIPSRGHFSATAPDQLTSYDQDDGSDNATPNACSISSIETVSSLSTVSEKTGDDLTTDLRSWAVLHNVPHSLLGSLLAVLRDYHPTLPKTARTLLATPKTIERCSISGMECVNLSLKEQLLDIISQNEWLMNLDSISISVNIDGMTPFKSSSTVLWPVLCSISNCVEKMVFPVTLSCGNAKPTDLTFLTIL